MWLQFFLENSHFAINLLAALVFFAVFWLLFDAWLARKSLKEGLKFTGFLLVSISFLVHATSIEATAFSATLIPKNLNMLIVLGTRILGYLLIIFGQLLDPLQPKPVTTGLNPNPSLPAIILVPLKITQLLFAFPILALTVSLLYLRRAIVGLESHLRPVAYSFLVLTLAEIVSLASLFQETKNVDLYNLVKTFGPLWLVEHGLLLFGTLLLGRWVLGYLLKRLQSQLFMIFNIMILVVFLLTTISFTALLLRNIQEESQRQLETDVKVLKLAIESKKGESLSDSQVVAQNALVITATKNKDRAQLAQLAQFSEEFLLTKNQSFLVIVNENGQVLARGEDSSRVGGSLSDDTLIRRALLGETASSITAKDGVLAPQIYVQSAVSVKEGGEVIGAVMTGTILDNAFVDGLKDATGLETAIYGDNLLSATTQVSTDGQTRAIGIKEENLQIKTAVLGQGNSFSGQVKILNVPYLAAYLPLKDVDNNNVGMVFVGRPELGILQTANRSVELTFVITAVLLLLSIIPAFLIARNLAKQLK